MKYVIANWKMNPRSFSAARAIAERIAAPRAGTTAVICPPAIYLSRLAALFGKRISWGVQNCFWEAEGAYTGEISAEMASDAGAKYAIIGHSERRSVFEETDEMISRKVEHASAAGMVPVICVGGGRHVQHRNVDIRKVIRIQMTRAFSRLSEHALSERRMVLAYEPVWAIGTGKPATKRHLAEVISDMRRHIAQNWGGMVSENMPILYGGSVNDKVADSMPKGIVDGFLVGGASLNPKIFSRIIKKFEA